MRNRVNKTVGIRIFFNPMSPPYLQISLSWISFVPVFDYVPILLILSQYLLLAKKARNFQKKILFEKFKFWMHNV